jgi:3'(2'), 5'-bisphosphate nucleotidase
LTEVWYFSKMVMNPRDKVTLDILQDIAREAGHAILQIYERPDTWDLDIKSDASPLTQADLRANEIICNALARLTPSIPVLSEESPWSGGDTSTYWAVDPLDGTKEFIKRNGEFTVNIALVENGKPVLGLVHAPVLRQFWTGVVEGSVLHSEPLGAFLLEDNTRNAIRAVGLSKEAPVRVVVSRSHPSPELQDWLAQFDQGVELVEKGSSLKLCYVAQGLAHVYPRFGPTCIWDTAAGHAVILAAGGLVQVAKRQWPNFLGANSSKTPLQYLDPTQVLNPWFIAWS